ncbi:MAG: hypothetical protein FJ254_02415 [Phycisphaerae bacterium]|nr:hypothetical protein [Phycisphaerae bacterium]
MIHVSLCSFDACRSVALSLVFPCVALQAPPAPTPAVASPQEAIDRPATQVAPEPVAPTPLIVLGESAVLDASQPTVSPTFGSVTGWAGSRLIVTGPERVRAGGFNGQIATFSESDGAWVGTRELAGISDTTSMETMLQSVVGNDEWLFTSSELQGRAGQVVVWKREPSASGWKQVQRLMPPVTRAEQAFGSALALGDGFLAVSAVDTRFRGEQGRAIVDAPRVYLFTLKDGAWTGAGSLSPDPALKAIWFGGAIAASGDQLAIASPKAWQPSPKQPVQESGESAVHIYRRGANGVWALRQSIAPPADCAWGGFGNRLGLRGNLLVVRATDIPSTVARMFTYEDGGTWVQSGELKGNASSGGGFGTSFDLGDGFIAVGDTTAKAAGDRVGAVTVFVSAPGGWSERYDLRPSVPVANRRYGVGVVVRERTVAVGRMKSETDGIEPGGALVFTIP